MKLTKKQTKALDHLEDSTTEELGYGGGAGGGKSALGCYWLAKSCLKYAGTRWAMGRSQLKTLKKTTLVTFFEVATRQGLRPNVHYRYNQNDGVIYFSNKSEILLTDLFHYPSDPNYDRLGSLEITGGFVDEFNQVAQKGWEVLKSRIRFKLDENDLIPKLMGSCNPSKNWVYQRFYKPSREGTLSLDKAFIQSLATDNPFISRHYIANLQKMTDKALKERLLYGNWDYDDDPAALMNFDRLDDLFKNSHVLGDKSDKYMTIDVARKGKDNSVIMIWLGWRVVKIVTLSKTKITETAEKVNALAVEYGIPKSNIIADEDGVGGGLVDIVGCKGFLNGSRPLPNPKETDPTKKQTPENYENLKTQCYYRLADKVNEALIYIVCLDLEKQKAITEELEQVKARDMDKDGKKRMVPKDKVKEILGRSPDYSDALAMRIWFDLKPKFKFLI